MKTLALKLLSLAKVESVCFTEDEIVRLYSMADLHGKLELLESIKDKIEYPCEKEIEELREGLIVACKEIGMFESKALDTIDSKFGFFGIDSEEVKRVLTNKGKLL